MASRVIHRRTGNGPTGAELKAMAERLKGLVVKVGLPASADAPKRYYSDGAVVEDAEMTLVEVATFNEFGTRDGRIPSRPFMATAAASGKGLLKTLARRLWVSVMKGTRPLEDLPELLGQKHVAQIQATINDGVPPDNAPRTVIEKGGSRTLIATGQLKQSITYAVVPAGEVER